MPEAPCRGGQAPLAPSLSRMLSPCGPHTLWPSAPGALDPALQGGPSSGRLGGLAGGDPALRVARRGFLRPCPAGPGACAGTGRGGPCRLCPPVALSPAPLAGPWACCRTDVALAEPERQWAGRQTGLRPPVYAQGPLPAGTTLWAHPSGHSTLNAGGAWPLPTGLVSLGQKRHCSHTSGSLLEAFLWC